MEHQSLIIVEIVLNQCQCCDIYAVHVVQTYSIKFIPFHTMHVHLKWILILSQPNYLPRIFYSIYFKDIFISVVGMRNLLQCI